MSAYYMSAVWGVSTPDSESRLVLLAIADSAPDDSYFMVCIEDISEKCRISYEDTLKAIQRLIQSNRISAQIEIRDEIDTIISGFINLN